MKWLSVCICVIMVMPLRVTVYQLSWIRHALGRNCFGYELSWVRVVLGMNCHGYELAWAHGDPGTSCLGYELSQVRVVLGTSWLGHELTWVRVVLGTSRLGYELSWVRVVLGTSCPDPVKTHTMYSCYFFFCHIESGSTNFAVISNWCLAQKGHFLEHQTDLI